MDVARGAAVALLIFVNNADEATPWWLPHTPWNGLHLADAAMPTFLVRWPSSMGCLLILVKQCITQMCQPKACLTTV